jgi:hypothetical protein
MEPEVSLQCSQNSGTCPILSQIKPLRVPQCISLWYFPLFSHLNSVRLNYVFPSSPPSPKTLSTFIFPTNRRTLLLSRLPQCNHHHDNKYSPVPQHLLTPTPTPTPTPHYLPQYTVPNSQNPPNSVTSNNVEFWSAHNSVSYYGSLWFCRSEVDTNSLPTQAIFLWSLCCQLCGRSVCLSSV